MVERPIPRLILIYFRFRLMPRTRRLIASTASKANGTPCGSQGYCLVFDIAEVARMLKVEGDTRYWAWLMLEPVRYADRPVEEIFPELVQGSANTLQQFVQGVRTPEMAVPEFLAGTTLLKGASYKLEREIRPWRCIRHGENGELRGEGISRPIRRDYAASRDQDSIRHRQTLRCHIRWVRAALTNKARHCWPWR